MLQSSTVLKCVERDVKANTKKLTLPLIVYIRITLNRSAGVKVHGATAYMYDLQYI